MNSTQTQQRRGLPARHDDELVAVALCFDIVFDAGEILQRLFKLFFIQRHHAQMIQGVDIAARTRHGAELRNRFQQKRFRIAVALKPT